MHVGGSRVVEGWHVLQAVHRRVDVVHGADDGHRSVVFPVAVGERQSKGASQRERARAGIDGEINLNQGFGLDDRHAIDEYDLVGIALMAESHSMSAGRDLMESV